MSDRRSPRGRPRLELVRTTGNPSERELGVLKEALERVVDQEREARGGSAWLRAARAQGRRMGMYDYRDRFSPEDAWRLSARLPGGGREYPGRQGRGDAK